jgi:hypothetical protein
MDGDYTRELTLRLYLRICFLSDFSAHTSVWYLLEVISLPRTILLLNILSVRSHSQS